MDYNGCDYNGGIEWDWCACEAPPYISYKADIYLSDNYVAEFELENRSIWLKIEEDNKFIYGTSKALAERNDYRQFAWDFVCEAVRLAKEKGCPLEPQEACEDGKEFSYERFALSLGSEYHIAEIPRLLYTVEAFEPYAAIFEQAFMSAYINDCKRRIRDAELLIDEVQWNKRPLQFDAKKISDDLGR